MPDIDVTDKVDFNYPDDEFLPLTKCVCGEEFHAWDHNLSIYRDIAKMCPRCGRKLYFSQTITVYEVVG